MIANKTELSALLIASLSRFSEVGASVRREADVERRHATRAAFEPFAGDVADANPLISVHASSKACW